MVSNELAEIIVKQRQKSETQNKNCAVVQEQFDILEYTIRFLTDCD